MSPRVIVLTKDPVPGRVKTRLFPVLNPIQSAQLHAEMVLETIRLAQASGLPVDVSLDGEFNGPFADQLRGLGCAVESQVDGDLGTRLRYALRGPGRRIALGTDCIMFEPDWLQQAAQCTSDVSIGPAEDGGYWCIGVDLTQADLADCLFSNQPWSRPSLLASTTSRLTQQGFSLTMLPECWDVDLPKDLDRLKRAARLPPPFHTILATHVRET